MIKKEIYPKTKRLPVNGELIQITEKLDGSNLVIFKKDEKLYFAQRNNIFEFSELNEDDINGRLYKGLYQWLLDNQEILQNELYDGSAICGEWLGMGKLKYSVDEFDKRFYMFAKARITDDFNLTNIMYNHSLFIYPFNSQKMPNFIGIVPVVGNIPYLPDKQSMDVMYLRYCDKVKRPVEGFVINYNDNIVKYVRMKNGKLQEHFDWEGK